MRGYGDILRIDLTSGSITRTNVPIELAKKFIGGMGINDWLLWEHFTKVDPFIDPMSKENVLIAGIGPLGATGLGSGSKARFTYKSPVTNFFGDSSCGGTWASQLRWAGIDYLVITGRASKPVYIYIENSDVEIRDAGDLWGLTTSETINRLYSIGIPSNAGIACIGPAGENGIKYSCIVVTNNRVAGRTGAGCVAGSKNLKAIVVYGTKGIEVYDPKATINVTRTIFEAIEKSLHIDNFKKNGTLGMVDVYNLINGNAYRNNQYNRMSKKKLKKISANWYIKNMKHYDIACSAGCTYACSSSCALHKEKKKIINNKKHIGQSPEYITVAAFGMECNILDYQKIIHLNELCNELGMDYEELGGIIPFMMELWDKKIITHEHTKKLFGEPLSLEWGNFDAVEKIIYSIAYQNNELGKICSHNTEMVSLAFDEITKKDTKLYSPAGKGGMALPEEIRPFPIWSIMVAVSPRGCDPMKGFNTLDKTMREDISLKWFGKPDAGKMYKPDLKGKAAAASENYTSTINCLGICMFRPTFDILGLPLDIFADAYNAITGFSITANDLLLAGERAYNMEKAFNCRLGFRRQHDRLCDRFMNEPVTQGPGKGMKVSDYFDNLLDEYYEFRGWNIETSLPTRKKLESLDLLEVADILEV